MGTIGRRSFVLGASATAATGAAAARAVEALTPVVWPRPLKDEATIRAKPFWEVTLRDDFWAPKIEVNRTVTIPFEIAKGADSARGLQAGVLQAAMFAVRSRPDATLQRYVDAKVADLLARLVKGNGSFELASTRFRLTGKRDLLDQARTQASALSIHFAEKDSPFSGGERDALNCVHLYRATNDPAHLALAKHYLDIRGRPDSVGRSRHNQSHKPVTEQTEAVGHAVNGVTLMLSLLEVGIATGRTEYADAAMRMWQDIVTSKLYVIGGVGQTGNEGFGEPFVLPTISAYAETCAVLMFINLNQRLFEATGDARFIDVMERGMYNNALSGVSQSGDRFFYVNRLASAGDGRDHRWQHALLECCPPNLVRFIASMPQHIYAEDGQGTIYLNLYVASEASFQVPGGTIGLALESGMPWSGTSRLRIKASQPTRALIKLRVPGWARERPDPGGLYAYAGTLTSATSIRVAGRAISAAPDAMGYVTIDRVWHDGDVVDFDVPLAARRVSADPRVREAGRRFAIERGPLVYCADWPHVANGAALDVVVPPTAKLTPTAAGGSYGGVVAIDAAARRMSKPDAAAMPLRLIPYYLWANQGPGQMAVWLPHDDLQPGDVGPAGGLIFYRNPEWARDGWRFLEAAPFDQSHGAQWGLFRREIAGARGTAIGTGRQNTADMLAAGVEPGSAAQLCASLKVNGITGWHLPSRDELIELYQALAATKIGDFRDSGFDDNVQYWASSQHDADMAAHVDFADAGRLHGDDKDFPRRVRAVRAF